MGKTNQLIKTLTYSFGGFSNGVYGAFTNVLLPLFLAPLVHSSAAIGFLVTISNLEAALAPAIIGPITDRINSPLGRRKLFLLVGLIITVVFLPLIPLNTDITVISLLILLAGLGRGITLAPFMAMLPKNSPPGALEKTSSLIAVFGLAGQVVLLIFAFVLWKESVPASAFLILTGLFLVPKVVVLLTASDDKKVEVEHSQSKPSIWVFFKDRTRNLYLVSQALIWFGINSVTPFFILFLTQELKRPQSQAILFYLIIIFSSGIFAYPFALLGKRIGKIKAFSIGLSAFGLVAILGIFIPQLPESSLYLLAFLAGFGNAATAVFTFTLLAEITPKHQIGQSSGTHSLLTAGFAPVAAILSGFLIDNFGFWSMFALLAVMTFLTLIALHSSKITHNRILESYAS